MAVVFIKIQHEQFVNLSWTIEIRSLISWVFSAEFCSVVCNLFSLLFVCLTVPQRTPSPQLLLRTNSLHFLSRMAFSLSDVYVVVVICCHSSSAVVHPWLGLQSWQECSPQDPGVERLFQSNINIWPPFCKSENTSMAPQKTADTTNRIPFPPTSRRKANVCTVFQLPPESLTPSSKCLI